MSIPTSAMQLLVLLVLVVPGFVYQAVRIRLRGSTPNDTELSSRIMNAIVASTVFALAYVLTLGPLVVDTGRLHGSLRDHPRLCAAVGFLAAFVVPALSALATVWLRNSKAWASAVESLLPDSWDRIDTRPSAWNVAFASITPCFVRVRMRDGTWFAGWMGEDSYASSWPEPRDLYVELSFEVDQDGTIGHPVEGSAGAVIDCEEAVLVELLRPASSSDGHTSGTMEDHEEDPDG